MKHIYEINIFRGLELICTFMCKSRKRAIEFINNTVYENEEGWLRTWTDLNCGVFKITENEQIK